MPKHVVMYKVLRHLRTSPPPSTPPHYTPKQTNVPLYAAAVPTGAGLANADVHAPSSHPKSGSFINSGSWKEKIEERSVQESELVFQISISLFQEGGKLSKRHSHGSVRQLRVRKTIHIQLLANVHVFGHLHGSFTFFALW